MESSSPSNLLDGYTKKENFMTTTVRGGVRGRVDEEQGGMEQEGPFEGISPLLLAALMGRRRGREEGEGVSPLLVAALLGGGSGGREEEGVFTLVVWAPLLAGTSGRREEEVGISPFVLAALMGRREEREKEMV